MMGNKRMVGLTGWIWQLKNCDNGKWAEKRWEKMMDRMWNA